MRLSLLLLVCALVSSSMPASATETEDLGIRIVPAPGAVSVDGRADDWDLSGTRFCCDNVEQQRDGLGLWLALMYDAKNVYVLAHFLDPTPCSNTGSIAGSPGFQDDCLQIRFITRYEQPDERVTHVTAWRDRAGQDVVGITWGREFKDGDLRDAKEKGAQQAFRVDDDGKGYVQEMALPWALLLKEGVPVPRAGDSIVVTVEPNFRVGNYRISMKGLFRPNVPLDRVFTFRAYRQWGIGTLEPAGRLAPAPMRLADGREFPLRLEQGRPAIDWAGLVRREESPGFKPVTFTMPEEGYVSLIIKDRTGAVVRDLLNCDRRSAGRQEVKWDGLTTWMYRTPGDALPPGEYTWSAIWHQGIGVRFRGWANNGGSAPWDNGPGTNWGGDHGVPAGVCSDGRTIFLGWTFAEAGASVVATDLQGKVLWKQRHSGMSGAGSLAVDGGVLYVLNNSLMVYRLDTKTGAYTPWQGSTEGTLDVANIWPAAQRDEMPAQARQIAAAGGRVFLSFFATGVVRSDLQDVKAALTALRAGAGPAGEVWAMLTEQHRKGIESWLAGRTDDDRFLKAIGALNAVDGVVRAMNAWLSGSAEGEEGEAPGWREASQRRAALEAAVPGLRKARGGLIAVLDGRTGALLKTLPLSAPGYLYAPSAEKLLVVNEESTVLELDVASGRSRKVVGGLVGATGVTADAQGNVYVAVGGAESRVEVFAPNGKLLRTIGEKGGRPPLGPWRSGGMAHMANLMVDPERMLWVMEADFYPKRVSVWDAATGKLMREFFGPTHYGASGAAIDPVDPNRMVSAGCEWRIDPATGRAACLGVFDRVTHGFARYCFGPNGTLTLATMERVGEERTERLKVFQRLGDGKWALRATVMPTVRPTLKRGETDTNARTDFWSDRNGDGQVQPDEVRSYPARLGLAGSNVWALNMNVDFTLYAEAPAEAGGNGLVLKRESWTPCGAPVWSMAPAKDLPPLTDPLCSLDNKTVISFDTKARLVRAYDVATGAQRWAYPDPWHQVHASHVAPPPQVGLMRGTFNAVGAAQLPAPLGAVWALNGNCGEWYLLTEEGYFLSQLFEGDVLKIRWPEQAVPGVMLNTCPPGAGGEDFGGSLTQGVNGKVYVQAGKTAAWNCEVTGLDTVKALGGGTITLTEEDCKRAQAVREEALQAVEGGKTLRVARKTPTFTGNAGRDFPRDAFVSYRKVDAAAVRTAALYDDTNLYLAWEVTDNTPWVNGAAAPEEMYLGGDTVDFQLCTDPKADPKRRTAGKGDLRLSIGSFQGKPAAVLYRLVSDDKAPKTFSSGVVRAYTMDLVALCPEVRIQVAKTATGYTVEAAVPLGLLGLAPQPGAVYQGDFGVTHGDPAGQHTRLRTYWSNQKTGIVDDAVFELQMEPANWGKLEFAP